MSRSLLCRAWERDAGLGRHAGRQECGGGKGTVSCSGALVAECSRLRPAALFPPCLRVGTLTTGLVRMEHARILRTRPLRGKGVSSRASQTVREAQSAARRARSGLARRRRPPGASRPFHRRRPGRCLPCAEGRDMLALHVAHGEERVGTPCCSWMFGVGGANVWAGRWRRALFLVLSNPTTWWRIPERGPTGGEVRGRESGKSGS